MCRGSQILVLLTVVALTTTTTIAYHLNANIVNDIDDSVVVNSVDSYDYSINSMQLLKPQQKRARLCGKKIIYELFRLCNGCIRPPDGVQILRKRAPQGLTNLCCYQTCSEDLLRRYCCMP